MEMIHKDRSFGKGDWKAYFRLIPYIRMPWLLVALAFIVELEYSSVMAYVPVSTSALFAGSFTGRALAEAIIYNVLNYVLLFASLIISGLVGRYAVRRAREAIWEKMLRVRMDYYDSHNPGGMAAIINNDIETAVTSIVTQAISIIPAIYYLAKVLSTLGSYDNRLLLSVVILIPVNVAYVVIVGRWKYEVNRGIFGRIGELTAYLAERVTNIFLIRSYTNEKEEERNGNEAAAGLYRANVRSAKVNLWSGLASSLMEILQRCVPVVFGIILLSRGAITLQEWIAFFLYEGQIISRVNTLVSTWGSIKAAQGSAARMVDVLKAPEEVKGNGERNVRDGDIVFRDVDFSYGDKKVLHNVSFTIPEGKTTCIVGRCGSGKTTLISLIERLYSPESGTITMDGREISSYDLEAWRDHFSYVQQDAPVFGGTLRSAVTYGMGSSVTDSEIGDASGKSGLASFVSTLPGGIDTPLAPGGSSVSGGQRQRIVLTRELLKNRPVMLLDEPTSALDAKTAYNVQKSMLELFGGKTKIMVTHDLRLLSECDHVIFMEEGRVAGSGSAAELLVSSPSFRALLDGKEAV